ncbi:hypothetical protein PV328_011907 [Microctonus aethiopoides]|uniref:Uncharacterized protein n=1 Tax=Microctonus aethiopoides TaxID=144406 RepID=A0AA39KQ80_9HYME|nr:hypothetical protein PV328_011907 [Microctonus aethiopoides]
MKGLKGGEQAGTEEAKKILRKIGIIEGIEEVKGARGMAIVKMESIEMKRRVMQEKRKLAGRKERIENDMTWKEREMMRKIEKIAVNERRRGGTLRVRYGRIEIDGKWWKWDEGREVLRDGYGVERETEEASNRSGEGRSAEENGKG